MKNGTEARGEPSMFEVYRPRSSRELRMYGDKVRSGGSRSESGEQAVALSPLSPHTTSGEVRPPVWMHLDLCSTRRASTLVFGIQPQENTKHKAGKLERWKGNKTTRRKRRRRRLKTEWSAAGCFAYSDRMVRSAMLGNQCDEE